MLMKTLSLQEPWASLITFREKRIETRGYRTKYRGWVLIHASMSLKMWGTVENKMPFYEAFQRHHSSADFTRLGQVIGIAQIEHCVPTESLVSKITSKERAFGNYGVGRYGWELGDAKRFKYPVPAKGCLYLWDFDLSKLHEEDRSLVERSVA